MENEIKVGEFIRSDLGRIGKVTRIEDNTTTKFFYEDEEFITVDKRIVRHSPNLIDIIQCGDYVNGEHVIHIDNNTKTYGEKTIITELNKRYFESQIIKVATKEMMESISYKVETYLKNVIKHIKSH